MKLEVLPKAAYHRQDDEVAFYQAFFERVSRWAGPVEAVVNDALEEASRSGLAAMDALHVSAAAIVGADEFVTAESASKPIHRTAAVPVATIRPA